ncbi:ABC transporter ATP-binding protein [Stappia sp.]|uniref:ABC transporter ATP-binding protein n=1 Tax=Stappia sp. TaxID=1870903 RepID=UPI003A99C516
MNTILDVKNLSIFTDAQPGGSEPNILVNSVDFHVNPGEVLGVVGESGSGKSLSCLALLGLIDGSLKTRGTLRFSGRTFFLDDPGSLRDLRGKKIGAVFQNPRDCLNPVRTIGAHFYEVLRKHGVKRAEDPRRQVAKMLEAVGVGDPAGRLAQYPHQLSGGLCQRVMIALALVARPELLIADEPTTALDTTVQAQVLDLIDEIRTREGMGVIFVSHDLGVIADIADRVAVMRRGTIVETSECADLFHRPSTPYARSLVKSLPHPNRHISQGSGAHG